MKRSDGTIRMMREYRHGDEKGEGGWSYTDLGSFFEMSATRASEICRGLAYPDAGGPIEKRVPGQKTRYNHSMNYPEEEAKAEATFARQQAKKGLSQRKIASLLGRSKSHIGNILHGRTRY